MDWNRTSKWLVPALIIAVGGAGGAYLARQDRAVKVNDQGQPVQAPAPIPPPSFVAPGGLPPIPPEGQPVQVPGGVIRSLDKINAAAARVGCDTLKPDDPAGKLIDVAECLGARAVAPGQK